MATTQEAVIGIQPFDNKKYCIYSNVSIKW